MTSVKRTVPAVLDRIAVQLSEHDALVTPDKRLTYGQLRTEVRRAAAAIVDLGVAPGDPVAIWSPTTWHWVVAALATHYAGAVVVPLNTRYTASEATDILARTEAPLLIAAGRLYSSNNDGSWLAFEIGMTTPSIMRMKPVLDCERIAFASGDV